MDNKGEEAVILEKVRNRMNLALKQMQKAHDILADIVYWEKGGEKAIPILRELNEAMRDLSDLIGQTPG